MIYVESGDSALPGQSKRRRVQQNGTGPILLFSERLTAVRSPDTGLLTLMKLPRSLLPNESIHLPRRAAGRRFSGGPLECCVVGISNGLALGYL